MSPVSTPKRTHADVKPCVDPPTEKKSKPNTITLLDILASHDDDEDGPAEEVTSLFTEDALEDETPCTGPIVVWIIDQGHRAVEIEIPKISKSVESMLLQCHNHFRRDSLLFTEGSGLRLDKVENKEVDSLIMFMDSFREWVFEADENKLDARDVSGWRGVTNDGEFEFIPIRLTYLD
jgi:hypothetical protein